MITSAIYNVNRKQGKRLLKPDEFMPRRKTSQTPEQMAMILRAVTEAMGGKVE